MKSKGALISKGEKGQDNAYAERLNGIIKNEYLKYWEIADLEAVRKAVKNYNNERIHNSLGKQTPIEFEKKLLNLSNQNRPKVIIYADGKDKYAGASSPLIFEPEAEPKVHICPIDYSWKIH